MTGFPNQVFFTMNIAASPATDSSESFAALFEESLSRQEMRIGEVITAQVARVDYNIVVVNAGLKSESFIPVEEFKNDKGEIEVKPGDFVAIGLPNSNLFFETTFAVWKCGATPTSLTWRLPRGEAAAVLDILKPSLVVGGQPDWNAPNSLPADLRNGGVPSGPVTRPVWR